MTTRRQAIKLLLSSTAGIVGINTVITSCTSGSKQNEVIIDSQQPAANSPSSSPGDDKSDINFLAMLGLMKGHLIVAEELLTAKKYKEAEPHFAHPVEELYADVEIELTKRNIPGFQDTLNKLQDLAKTAPQSPEMMQVFQESMGVIDKAIAAIPPDRLASPEVVNLAMVQILKTAASEYEAAIEEGKIVEPIEYQDSRGFFMYGEQLYNTVATVMKQKKPDNHKMIMENLTALKTVWPSIIPPEKAVKEPQAVNDLISAIESYA